jgi:hypothetical protein
MGGRRGAGVGLVNRPARTFFLAGRAGFIQTGHDRHPQGEELRLGSDWIWIRIFC